MSSETGMESTISRFRIVSLENSLASPRYKPDRATRRERERDEIKTEVCEMKLMKAYWFLRWSLAPGIV